MKTLLILSLIGVHAAFATPALAQVNPAAPALPRSSVGTPALVQSAPDQTKVKECTVIAAKREAKERDAFTKFCVDYKGTAAAATSEFHWDIKENKKM